MLTVRFYKLRVDLQHLRLQALQQAARLDSDLLRLTEHPTPGKRLKVVGHQLSSSLVLLRDFRGFPGLDAQNPVRYDRGIQQRGSVCAHHPFLERKSFINISCKFQQALQGSGPPSVHSLRLRLPQPWTQQSSWPPQASGL
jgi:hypothetical protein